MGQVIFDFLQQLINLIFNVLVVPFFAVVKVVFPYFDTILNWLDYAFNNYVWNVMKFVFALLRYGLHVPPVIFIIISNTLTATLGIYVIVKATVFLLNVWQIVHGYVRGDEDKRL